MFRNRFESQPPLRVGGLGSAEPIPMRPTNEGINPSLAAAYTNRLLVNVVELSDPKQEALTISANMSAPTGPKTLLPNATATVLVLLRTCFGRTRKYEKLASI